MIEVFRNDYFLVRRDSPTGVIEVVRSNRCFDSPQAAAIAFLPLLECLDQLGRARYSLLFDARDSVANNNPDYESWYARYRAELVRDFQRVAILMRTPAGGLQATRLLPPTTGMARVFLDAEQAWAFVKEPGATRSSKRPSRGDDTSLSNDLLEPATSGASGGWAQQPGGKSRLPPTG